jgi:hypothetical protein
MAFVSVTRLHLQSPRYLPAFVWHNALSVWQIINTCGFLGGQLVRDNHGGFWTITLWEDKLAMQHYRNSGAHHQVMPLIQNWCDEASVAHWEQVGSNLPDIAEAYGRIENEGHFTRLKKPNGMQLEGKIPKPSPNLKGLPLRARKKLSRRVGV